jgi:hypothetical protein
MLTFLNFSMLDCNPSLLQYVFQVTANNMQRFFIYSFPKTPYLFQAVPPPIIKSTKLYKQLELLSDQYCCYRG